MRISIRKPRPIANSPEIAFWQRDCLARSALRLPRRAPCAAEDHAAPILKKYLSRCDVTPPDENMVDKALRASERRGGEAAWYATGADDKSCRIACRKTLRMYKNPI